MSELEGTAVPELGEPKIDIGPWTEYVASKGAGDAASIKEKLIAAGMDDANTCDSLEAPVLWDALKETGLPLRARTVLAANTFFLKQLVGDDLQMVSHNGTVGNGPLFWGRALVLAPLFTVLPVLLIALVDSAVPDQPTNSTTFLRTFLCGLALFAVVSFFSPTLSMFFANDVIQERSFGTDFKSCMIDQMQNAGVVAALIGSMVAGLLTADPPSETDSIINQGFIVLNVASIFFSVNAVLLSVITLMYLQPLDGAAAEKFICFAGLYFGEPITGIFYSVVLFLDAVCIWVWGAVGPGAGAFTLTIVCSLLIRLMVTTQWLSGWRNWEIPQKERDRRYNFATLSEHEDAGAKKSDRT